MFRRIGSQIFYKGRHILTINKGMTMSAMKKYLKLIRESDTNTRLLTRQAGSMTQEQFNKLLKEQRQVVKNIWTIRESGVITYE